MTNKEAEEFNKKFLDTLNLDKYVESERDIQKIIDAIEYDYDDVDLPIELEGCIFNYLGTEDIAWYFADRYGFGCTESIIYKYTLYNK